MTRILTLHVGFPKTATTTIQAGVLEKLHNQGCINYIGNAEHSDNPELKLLDKLLRKVFFRENSGEGLYGALNRNSGFLSGLLCDSRPNVLSSEYFTIPGFGGYTDASYPEMLLRAFAAKDVSIRVIITARTQTSLLNSFYAHFYEWVHRYGDAANISRAKPDIDGWVSENILSKTGKLRNSFDFDQTARIYGDVFGENNVRVNLFEDLKDFPERHFSDWALLTGLPVQRFASTFGASEAHRVRSSKGGERYLVEIPRGSARWMRIQSSSRFSEKSTPIIERALWKVCRHLPVRSVSVSGMTESIAMRVRSTYSANNRAVFTRHGFDIDRIRSLGYL